ncbi:hypothetical protein K438DRAFT_1773328 [Mycena galopus ATCC 62051]|nr:hypothetical protein K438DRAFT_1773328 [Mycena galopus ATCC 62051]
MSISIYQWPPEYTGGRQWLFQWRVSADSEAADGNPENSQDHSEDIWDADLIPNKQVFCGRCRRQPRRCGASLRPGNMIGSTRWSSFIHIGYDLQGPEFSVNGVFPLTSGTRFFPSFALTSVRVQSGYGGVRSNYWVYPHRSDRTMVAFLFIVNMNQAAAVVYMSWNFANPRVVAIFLWPYPVTALTTAVLAITNQMFQLWRIYLFTGSRIRVGFLVVTSLAACGTGIAAAIQAWVFSELDKIAVLQPVAEANLALQCAVDVILTVYSNSKTTFPRTDKVFNRLIRTAVQSGFFTSVFALGTLFSFRFAPSTYMVALFALPIGRIYTHTMMDHFISREPLRNNLSNSRIILTVPNFHATGEESGSSEDGTATSLRNISPGIKIIKANETV